MYIYALASRAAGTHIHSETLHKERVGKEQGGGSEDVCVHVRVVRERKENTPTRDRVTQDK